MVAWLLFKEIVVLILMIMGGYTLVKAKVVDSKDSHVLSIISIYLVSPLVLINAFQVEYTDAIRNGFIFATIIAFFIHFALVFITKILSLFFKFNEVEKASIIYSNAGNLIIPLVLALFGKEWIIYASAYMMVQQLFLWSHGVSLMSESRKFDFKKILSNINVIAIFIGLALFLMHIQLPAIPARAVSNVASMIGPISMIMLGMIFAGAKWSEFFSQKKIYLVIFFKMVLVPGIILFVLKLSQVELLVENGHTILLISLLATIAPTAAMVTQISRLYNRQPSYAASINMVTTTLSILTMPILIFFFNL